MDETLDPAQGQPPGGTEQPAPPAPERTFTQADVDRIIAARIAGLREKAEAYDKAQEAAKTESQKQAEEMARMRAELDSFKAAEACRKAASDARLPPAFAALVRGVTEEEIAESVKLAEAAYAEAVGPKVPQPDRSQGRGPAQPVVASVAQARDKYAQERISTELEAVKGRIGRHAEKLTNDHNQIGRIETEVKLMKAMLGLPPGTTAPPHTEGQQ